MECGHIVQSIRVAYSESKGRCLNHGHVHKIICRNGVMGATRDLKSLGQKWPCGFESRFRYKTKKESNRQLHQIVGSNQHLLQWLIGEIGLRGRLVIYFHFYLFVGVLFLDLRF